MALSVAQPMASSERKPSWRNWTYCWKWLGIIRRIMILCFIKHHVMRTFSHSTWCNFLSKRTFQLKCSKLPTHLFAILQLLACALLFWEWLSQQFLASGSVTSDFRVAELAFLWEWHNRHFSESDTIGICLRVAQSACLWEWHNISLRVAQSAFRWEWHNQHFFNSDTISSVLIPSAVWCDIFYYWQLFTQKICWSKEWRHF